MDERLRFVARLLDGEKMAALCREFDVSRKTGYKIFPRYKGCGLEGLTDRSRRPYRHANQLPFQIEKLIIQLKRERPSWGDFGKSPARILVPAGGPPTEAVCVPVTRASDTSDPVFADHR